MMKTLGRFLPYAAGLALVALLVRQINLREVFELLRNANLLWLAIGCGFYLLTNLMRACRFGVLLKQKSIKPIWIRLLPEMFALSFLNNVLPSRTGEISFPYLMQQRHQISFAESTTALLIARIFDYLAIITLFVFFALYEIRNLDPSTVSLIAIVIGVCIVSIGFLLLMPWLSTLFLALFRRVLSIIKIDETKFGRQLLKFGQEVIIAMRQLRSGSVYLQTYGWSLATWLCTFAWFGAFLTAIGMPVRYTLVVVGATFASLAKAIPFITIGGFGAHEAGWSIGFSLTGMAPATALVSGFTVNVLTLAMSIIFGGTALVWMSIRKAQND